MRTNKQIMEIAQILHAQATKKVAEYEKNKVGELSGIATKSHSDAVKIIAELIDGVKAKIMVACYQNVMYQDVLYSHSLSADNSVVTITIKSRLKAKNKVKQTTTVSVNDKFITNVANLFLEVVSALYYYSEADTNIECLNEKLAKTIANYGISKKISFVCVPDNSNIIISASDDEIVYNASVTSALKVTNLGIMQGGNEYNQLVAAQAEAEFVDAVKAAQTVPRIIKAQPTLVSEMVGTVTKKRVSKILRGTYHKQAKNLIVGGVGYVEGEVSGVKVFGLVEKTENGYNTVLTPFNVENNTNVQVDINALI